jgi:hypothetical protein
VINPFSALSTSTSTTTSDAESESALLPGGASSPDLDPEAAVGFRAGAQGGEDPMSPRPKRSKPLAGDRAAELAASRTLRREAMQARAAVLSVPFTADGGMSPIPIRKSTDPGRALSVSRLALPDEPDKVPRGKRLLGCIQRVLPCPRISEKYSQKACSGILFGTGLASGLLGGLVGSGGPPQIIAFSVLKPDKSVIRGVKVFSTTVANAIRLLMFAVSGTNMFSSEPWWVYVCVCVASLIGSIIGTKVRDYFPTRAILLCLNVLLYLSTAFLFRAIEKLIPAIAFGTLTIVLAAALVLIYFFPLHAAKILHGAAWPFKTCYRSMLQRCRRSSKAPRTPDDIELPGFHLQDTNEQTRIQTVSKL